MANTSKSKGTRRETSEKRKARARGLDCIRSENHAPGRDLDIRADVLRIVEVKDRKQGNAHRWLKKTRKNHPDYPAAVVWHRTSVKSGNTQASPDGPTLAHLPSEDYYDLLAVAEEAAKVVQSEAEIGSELAGLSEAVQRIRDKYEGATT